VSCLSFEYDSICASLDGGAMHTFAAVLPRIFRVPTKQLKYGRTPHEQFHSLKAAVGTAGTTRGRSAVRATR
jgi:hypothetical protein